MRPAARPRRLAVVIAALAAALSACRPGAPPGGEDAPPEAPVAEVRIDAEEADAALAILEMLRTGTTPAEPDWKRLFASEGYRRLKQREESMKRSFEDAAFADFLRSERTRAAAPALAAILAQWKQADTTAAARRALAYLPAGTRIRATIYPVVKPQTNSFVFDTASNPAIFMYLDPDVPRPKLENTLAHELHHIGYAAACDAAAPEGMPEGVAAAIGWAGAVGEGLAMLAAAGGPDIHPHAVSAPDERARWDADVANVPADLARVETFFLDVIEGKLEDDAIRETAMGFFGVQGPWYTVGWSMSTAIEEVYGRDRLIEVMCDSRMLIATYNAAAMESTSNGRPRPLWSERLMERLGP